MGIYSRNPGGWSMDVVFLIARVIFGLTFVVPGIQAHLVQRRPTVELARMSRVPLPGLMVPFAGLLIVGGGAMVSLGLWADLGALLLAAFSLTAAFRVHGFWRVQDHLARLNQMGHFGKNLGLAAGAVGIYFVYQSFPDAPFSLAGPLL
jgi:putative oxidoreductase